MIDWIGRTLGRVQVESLIARGGMAEVYLGTHTTLQRKVAVKILRNQHGDDPRLLERFELEARAVARLRHPNIVQVYDFATVEDQPYIVMEYIRGPSLSKYLGALHARNGRLGLPLIRRVLTGVAIALQYAHESGVIHRDVKPGNILLTSRSIEIIPGETLPLDFQPVLTDFGLVRILDANRQTTTGMLAGTPAYMSPEQALGEPADGRTDIYSLGIVLYEMLSGQVPFDGETTMSVLFKHINEEPAPIPGLSSALQKVLDRALAKNRDDRFQEPTEFTAAFNHALEEITDASTVASIPVASPPTKVNRGTPLRGNKRFLSPLLAGVLVVSVFLSMVFNGTPPAAQAETPTSPSASNTPTFVIPVTLGPASILQFQNGNALLDRATLIAQAMPAPSAGSQYEVWLVNGDERLSLGILSVDSGGRGELTFDDPQARNLLSVYQGVEITIIPSASSSDPPRLAYAFTLSNPGLAYLRGLMVSFPTTPQQVGLIDGLMENAESMDQAARKMLDAYQNGNETGMRENAEAMLNILVGDQSPDYQDWNNDGQVSDPGDGYGSLLNGDQTGYIQAVYSHADYAVHSPGATRNMIVNGENVKACAQNLARWAPELRQHLLTILHAEALSEKDVEVQRSAELASQMLSGIDLNENGRVEPVPGECGALAASEYTYRMADMSLLPVAEGEIATPSQTPTPSSLIFATPTRHEQVQPPAATAVSTRDSKPTQKPKPTEKPKPTKKSP